MRIKFLKPICPAVLPALLFFALFGTTLAEPPPGEAPADPLAEYELVPNKDQPELVARVYRWTREVARFDAGLRQLAKKAKVPGKEEFEKRLKGEAGDLEVITDGYGGFVDFDAAKGTVQEVANKKVAGMVVDWEFELFQDTEVHWDKSTHLIPRMAGPAKDGEKEAGQPIFGIHIAKASAGPFQAGDRVRLRASIDDFSRFRKDYSEATGLVAIYYLEEAPNPFFELRLDEAQVSLVKRADAEQAPEENPGEDGPGKKSNP